MGKAHSLSQNPDGSYSCECNGTHGGKLTKLGKTKGDVTNAVINSLSKDQFKGYSNPGRGAEGESD